MLFEFEFNAIIAYMDMEAISMKIKVVIISLEITIPIMPKAAKFANAISSDLK